MKKLERKLESMKGKTFQYANQIHYIIDYTIDEQKERFVIKTNIREFDRTFDAAEEFLSYWTDASTITAIIPSAEVNPMIQIMQDESNKADKLIKILEDNIDKVQKDATYIPQATSINNNVNTIVNIEKMRMALIKTAKGKRA